jgi:hypothetical protein
MKWMRGVRFRLSTLLVLVTLAAAGFGYVRYTRGVLLATCKELEADGVEVTFEEVGPRWLRRTIDSDFWLRKAVKGRLTIVQVGPSLFNVAGRNLGLGESEQALAAISERLRRIGVADMTLEIMPAPFFWHEPRGTRREDQDRQVMGDSQKRQLESFAAAHGFAGNAPVFVMGASPLPAGAPPGTSAAPAGK